jgi:transcriptional regulator with XRE-family HTH domain
MDTSSRIARARRLMGLKQFDLADRLAVEREHLARLESGAKKPSAELLQRLADLLERHLVRSVMRRAKRARSEAEAESDGVIPLLTRDRFTHELGKQVRPLMRLLAHALVVGDRAMMDTRAWRVLLGIGPRVLRGVPTSGLVNRVPLYSAPFVGLAIEAAIRGQRLREFARGWGPSEPDFVKEFWESVGMERFDVELEHRAAHLDCWLTQGVLTSEYEAGVESLRQKIDAK